MYEYNTYINRSIDRLRNTKCEVTLILQRGEGGGWVARDKKDIME